MSGFLGTFADLTNYRLGEFRVDALVGRNASGHPEWRIVCGKCGECQLVPHLKIASRIESKAAQSIQCTNAGCELSRTHRRPVTLADIKREERAEADRQAERTAADKTKAAAEAAKQAKVEALRNEWRSVWRHQIKTKIAEEKIVSFQRWCQLSDGTRQMVLETLRKDPGAYYTGL